MNRTVSRGRRKHVWDGRSPISVALLWAYAMDPQANRDRLASRIAIRPNFGKSITLNIVVFTKIDLLFFFHKMTSCIECYVKLLRNLFHLYKIK